MNKLSRREFLEAAVACAVVAKVGVGHPRAWRDAVVREVMSYDIYSDQFMVRYDVKGTDNGREIQAHVSWGQSDHPEPDGFLDPDKGKELLFDYLKRKHPDFIPGDPPELPPENVSGHSRYV